MIYFSLMIQLAKLKLARFQVFHLETFMTVESHQSIKVSQKPTIWCQWFC